MKSEKTKLLPQNINPIIVPFIQVTLETKFSNIIEVISKKITIY